MTLEEALFQCLTTNAEISPIIATRAYPLSLPTGRNSTETGVESYPAVVYKRVNAKRPATHAGYSGFVAAGIRIEAISPSYDQAKDLDAKIRKAIAGLRGELAGGLIVQAVLQVDEHEDDGYDDKLDLALCFISTDYVFWHVEQA